MTRSPISMVAAATLGVVFALDPASTLASPPPREDRGPWSRGVMAPSLGIGMSFGPDIHVLDFGLGFSYFVIDGLSVGLGVSDTVYIYREDFKNAYPGIEDETPSNVVRLIPDIQYVFLRRLAFSPYIHAGVGPVFYNRGRGVVGQWVTGIGAYIGLAPHFALSLGIDVGANFPDSAWQEAFSYMGESIRGCALIDSLCSFNIFPRIGFVAYFGGGSGGKNKRKKTPPTPPEALPPSQPPAQPPPPAAEPVPAASPPAATDAQDPGPAAEPVPDPVPITPPSGPNDQPAPAPESPPPSDVSPPDDSTPGVDAEPEPARPGQGQQGPAQGAGAGLPGATSSPPGA